MDVEVRLYPTDVSHPPDVVTVPVDLAYPMRAILSATTDALSVAMNSKVRDYRDIRIIADSIEVARFTPWWMLCPL